MSHRVTGSMQARLSSIVRDRRPPAAMLAAGLGIALLAAAATPAPADDHGGIGCLTDIARSYQPPAGAPIIDPGETPFGPPPNPQVGDEWDWFIWSLAGFPTATLMPCTVRGMGQHCYVVVENSQWNVHINQVQVDHIVDRFDNMSIGPYPDLGIYDIDVQTYGIPPDRLDNDDRIYIMYYDFDVSSDGFFWAFDESPEGTVPPFHSNECEVVYINDSDNDPAGDYLTGVLAHEFEHMIHWEYDSNEDAWVDEGLAELAMWLYGHPDHISSFNSNPDNNLTEWNAAWADYIKTYLWSLYFYERYGGAASVYDVVHNPANSISGYEQVLDAHGYPENFADAFADWVVANYLDDPSLGDGRWGYVGDDLPAFNHSATHMTYPFGPINAFVNHWAADYIRFLDAASGLEINFNGADATSFAAWALELDPAQTTQVHRLTLDTAQDGSISLPSIGGLYERAVLVVANNSSLGSSSYAYDGDTGVTGIAAAGAPSSAQLALLRPRPNPFNPSVTLSYELPAATGAARLVVLDAQGRHVQTLLEGALPAGAGSVRWDGRTARNGSAPSGVYYFRLEADGAAAQTMSAALVR